MLNKRGIVIAMMLFEVGISYGVDKFDIQVCEALAEDASKNDCYSDLHLNDSCRRLKTTEQLSCYRKSAEPILKSHETSSSTPEQAASASAEPCGSGSTKSGRTLRVNGTGVVLRSAPNATSDKLINQKATQTLKTTLYLTIDNTVTVVEECTQDEWSRVRVREPDWLQNSHIGWVQSSSLRGQKKDSDGIIEFTEADFVWDAKTSLHKRTIVAGVNKVHRENSRCKTIDPGTAYISSSKGSPSDPVFYVTCGTGAGVFNAFFSKSEVEMGTTLAAAKHIDRSRAIDLCESYAKSRANHPSTFNFSRVMDLAVSEHPNGRTTVTSSFTAKNSFNLELKHNIRCLLDSSGLIEANVSEAK